MPTTGLFYLPTPLNTLSPLPQLSAHISRSSTNNPTPLAPYTLDYRLYASTSAIAFPTLNTHQYTHVLTLDPSQSQTTFIATGTSQAMVAIPRPETPAFMALLDKKMQPLWAARTGFRVERGVGVALNGGEVKVRLGDLRVSEGVGVGRVKGVLVQIDLSLDFGDEGGEAAREQMLRALFQATFRDTGVDLGDVHVFCGVDLKPTVEGEKTTEEGFELARMYLAVLRFPLGVANGGLGK